MTTIATALPSGHSLVLQYTYTDKETDGLTALIVGSAISFVSVTLLLGTIMFRLISSLFSPSNQDQAYIRTHITYYFICLMIADLGQAVGSIMTSRWMELHAVILEDFCIAQGAIKNTSNVATALWILVIALHTWALLFLRWKPNNKVFYATLFGVWLCVGLVALSGPAIIQTKDLGPYFGVSGYWCWIGNNYPVERITLEYLFMFVSAGASFVLYTLVFLRYRGNIVVSKNRIRLQWVRSSAAWKLHPEDNSIDSQMVHIMKQMLWYPVVYTIIVLPIAVCRFLEWTGHEVSFGATIFSDTVFVLGGFMNVLLFTTTRRIIPLMTMWPSLLMSRLSRPSIFSDIRSRWGSFSTERRNSKDSPSYHIRAFSVPESESSNIASYSSHSPLVPLRYQGSFEKPLPMTPLPNGVVRSYEKEHRLDPANIV